MFFIQTALDKENLHLSYGIFLLQTRGDSHSQTCVDHAMTWYDHGDSYSPWYDHGKIIARSSSNIA